MTNKHIFLDFHKSGKIFVDLIISANTDVLSRVKNTSDGGETVEITDYLP